MPLIPAAAVLLSVLVTQVEQSSWSAPPNAPHEPAEAPDPGGKPAAAGGALAPGGTQIRDVALGLGPWLSRPYGIEVLGGVLHVSFASEMGAGALRGKFVEVACDVSGGRTAPGLPVAESAVALTVWSTPRSAMRAGAGLDASLVGYRRATTGGWEMGTSAGGHLAVHADMLRGRDRAGFVEVSAGIRALSRGAELSAVALVGLAFRTEAILVRRAERAPLNSP